MNISFRHTVHELISGQKTVTRRLWADKTAACFKKGSIHTGWTAMPSTRGAQRAAMIEATEDAYQEKLSDITKEEVVAEGFPDMTPGEFIQMFTKMTKAKPDVMVWVARFKLTSVLIGRNKGER